MHTTHRVVVGDARSMDELDDGSVELVVTSPPYPMIEMWDQAFAELDPAVGEHLDEGEGQRAFEAMHRVLDDVWSEVERVLAPGGLACINVGDATRSIGGRFRLFPNHARILDAFQQRGFEPLPDILWRKPANSSAKFMGSGMLPPNAYATLEHEHILVLRKGARRRSFEPGADDRYEAAYFWEERNRWFTDLWTDVSGRLQSLEHDELRDRSAAYPLEVPYRLVNMYSAYGDTVLDPFWGTGTTSLAAACSARSSVGYEIEPSFVEAFREQIQEAPSLSRRVLARRLDRHRRFVEGRVKDGKPPGYEAEHYGFPVVTQQEQRIRFRVADQVHLDEGLARVEHAPLETGAPELLDEPAGLAVAPEET